MKKSLLTISVSLFSLGLNAQQIPNGGFDSWTTNTFGTPPFSFSYEEPNDWTTFNAFVGTNSLKPIQKSTDKIAGTFSLQAQNVVYQGLSGQDTASGIALIRFKVTQFPQFLSGFYKSDIKGAKDSVSIFALATKYNTATKQSDFVAFAGMAFTTSQATFKPFNLSFLGTPGITPDSILIAITSAGNIKKNRTPGTSFWIDDLAVTYNPLAISESGFNEKEVTIYPSPASEVFYISGLRENTTSFKLYNSQGIEVRTAQISSTEKTEVNVKDQPKGLYFVETYDKFQNKTSKSKVVVQ